MGRPCAGDVEHPAGGGAGVRFVVWGPVAPSGESAGRGAATPPVHGQPRAIPLGDLEELWRRRTVPLREKTLWRMLYETAARASEVLALDVGDLDRARRRARIRSKGGSTDMVVWAAPTARLSGRYLADRPGGPLFLTRWRTPHRPGGP